MTKAQRILALELFAINQAPWRNCCASVGVVVDEPEDSETWKVYREQRPTVLGEYGGWVHDTIQLAALELAQRYREGSV